MEWLISVCNPKSSVPIGMVGNLVSFIKFLKRVEVEDLIKQGEGFPFEEKKRFVYDGGFYEFQLFPFYNYCKNDSDTNKPLM